MAKRFEFRYTKQMQDWEVDDYSRINEFIEVYESIEISDDEKFTLMETIIQAQNDLRVLLGRNR